MYLWYHVNFAELVSILERSRDVPISRCHCVYCLSLSSCLFCVWHRAAAAVATALNDWNRIISSSLPRAAAGRPTDRSLRLPRPPLSFLGSQKGVPCAIWSHVIASGPAASIGGGGAVGLPPSATTVKGGSPDRWEERLISSDRHHLTLTRHRHRHSLLT